MISNLFMQRWMIFVWIVIAGSLIILFSAILDATKVIGNTPGTLYPPIRQQASYAALLESFRGNFGPEGM